MRLQLVNTNFNNNTTAIYKPSRVSFFTVLIITFIYFSQVSLQFRFCYKGEWHQIGMSTKCPFGIAFPQPVSLFCAYENFQREASKTRLPFKMDGFQDHKPKEVENLAHNLPEIQMVWYDEGKDNFNVNTGKMPLDVVDLNECIETCGASVEEESSDSSESPEIKATDPGTASKIKEQTTRLGDYMYDITFNSNFTIHLNYRIVDILKRSFDVLKHVCPDPFIPKEFNSRVLNGFLFLLSDSGAGTLYDITDEEYQDIKDSLDDCKDQRKTFELDGTVCSAKATVDTIVTIDDRGERVARSWKDSKIREEDVYRYDLFIDSTWKVVDVVHAVCFVHFQPNTNMHHRYQTAMEYLFTADMRTRWRNPTQLINNEAWGSFFLVDIQSTIQNLYACERAAYLNTPFEMKLDRPLERLRYKRDLSSQTNEVSRGNLSPSPDLVYLSRNKRASRRHPRNYWENYEAEGGIEAKLGGQIFCFKDDTTQADGDSGRTEIFRNLQSRC